MPESFTSLEIWQIGYHLTLMIYEQTSRFPSNERFGLVTQLQRSANSVIANIAESQGRYSYKDKIRVLHIARAEIYETMSHMQVAKGLGYLPGTALRKFDAEYDLLLRKLNSYIRYLNERFS